MSRSLSEYSSYIFKSRRYRCLPIALVLFCFSGYANALPTLNDLVEFISGSSTEVDAPNSDSDRANDTANKDESMVALEKVQALQTEIITLQQQCSAVSELATDTIQSAKKTLSEAKELSSGSESIYDQLMKLAGNEGLACRDIDRVRSGAADAAIRSTRWAQRSQKAYSGTRLLLSNCSALSEFTDLDSTLDSAISLANGAAKEHALAREGNQVMLEIVSGARSAQKRLEIVDKSIRRLDINNWEYKNRSDEMNSLIGKHYRAAKGCSESKHKLLAKLSAVVAKYPAIANHDETKQVRDSIESASTTTPVDAATSNRSSITSHISAFKDWSDYAKGMDSGLAKTFIHCVNIEPLTSVLSEARDVVPTEKDIFSWKITIDKLRQTCLAKLEKDDKDKTPEDPDGKTTRQDAVMAMLPKSQTVLQECKKAGDLVIDAEQGAERVFQEAGNLADHFMATAKEISKEAQQSKLFSDTLQACGNIDNIRSTGAKSAKQASVLALRSQLYYNQAQSKLSNCTQISDINSAKQAVENALDLSVNAATRFNDAKSGSQLVDSISARARTALATSTVQKNALNVVKSNILSLKQQADQVSASLASKNATIEACAQSKTKLLKEFDAIKTKFPHMEKREETQLLESTIAGINTSFPSKQASMNVSRAYAAIKVANDNLPILGQLDAKLSLCARTEPLVAELLAASESMLKFEDAGSWRGEIDTLGNACLAKLEDTETTVAENEAGSDSDNESGDESDGFNIDDERGEGGMPGQDVTADQIAQADDAGNTISEDTSDEENEEGNSGESGTTWGAGYGERGTGANSDQVDGDSDTTNNETDQPAHVRPGGMDDITRTGMSGEQLPENKDPVRNTGRRPDPGGSGSSSSSSSSSSRTEDTKPPTLSAAQLCAKKGPGCHLRRDGKPGCHCPNANDSGGKEPSTAVTTSKPPKPTAQGLSPGRLWDGKTSCNMCKEAQQMNCASLPNNTSGWCETYSDKCTVCTNANNLTLREVKKECYVNQMYQKSLNRPDWDLATLRKKAESTCYCEPGSACARWRE